MATSFGSYTQRCEKPTFVDLLIFENLYIAILTNLFSMRTKQNVFEEVINNIVYDLAFHLSRKGRQMRCDTKLVALIEVVMAAIFFKVKKPRRVTYLVKILISDSLYVTQSLLCRETKLM